MMVKDIVVAELKRRFTKFILIKVAPILGLVLLLVLLIGGIVESLSKIPIVGDRVASEMLGDDVLAEFEEFNIINFEKVQVYLDIERESYPYNDFVSSNIYEETLGSLSHKSKVFFVVDETSMSARSEIVPFDIGDETKNYRLWWQAVGGLDIITDGSSDLLIKIPIETFKTELGPRFIYSFNAYDNSDFTYFDKLYTAHFTETLIYRDGVLGSEDRHQVNKTKYIPKPYLLNASTMFMDYTFSYTPTVLSESDWEVIDDTEEITYEYIVDSTGSYVSVGGTYEIRTSSNAKESSAGYSADGAGDLVRYYPLPYYYVYIPYDMDLHSDKQCYTYEEAVYRTRYEQVTVKTMIQVSQKMKTEGYTIAITAKPNTRYDDFMSTNNFDGKLAESDKELMIDTAALFPNAFEFIFHANNYIGYNARGLYLGGYSGTGDYIVTDRVTDYVVPILFDESLVEKSVRVTSLYGPGTLTKDGVTKQRIHHGLDIGIPTGTPLVAAAKGTVTTVAYASVEGNYVAVTHENGYRTLYMHLSLALVNVGDEVEAGDVIAASGNTGYSTGPHLHFAIKDLAGNTYDPLYFIPLVPK